MTRKVEDVKVTRRKPAMNPEAREQQMIGYAVDLAEKQLIEGTASAAVITHYLRLGTEKTKLERLKLEKEIKLVEAKADSIESSARSEELYSQAIEAMKSYAPSQD